MSAYKVTIAVLTYNPDIKKLFMTLQSILEQKNVTFQVVLSDDGSVDNKFTDVENWFSERQFSDYSIVRNQKNQGTVRNFASALEYCEGEYVKPLSPGDLLLSDDILCQWIEKMENHNAQISFSEAVHYVYGENGVNLLKKPANPQIVSCYDDYNIEACRFNYLVYNDLFLGAATLCTRDILNKYIAEIDGKVLYAEDNIYRLMAYDRVPVCHFPEKAIFYESDTGVSTSGNTIWKERLKRDWDACTSLLRNREIGKDKVQDVLVSGKSRFRQKVMKVKITLTTKGMLKYYMQRKKGMRMTETILPDQVVSVIKALVSAEGEDNAGY